MAEKPSSVPGDSPLGDSPRVSLTDLAGFDVAVVPAVTLSPTDVLIVRIKDEDFVEDRVNRMTATIRQLFPHIRVLICPKSVDVLVVDSQNLRSPQP